MPLRTENPRTRSRPPAEFAALIESRTATGIAAELANLIRQGVLQPGEQLPPIRAIAKQLGISPGTVSTAWTMVRKRGLIAASGRAGTVVLGEAGDITPRPRRYAPEGDYGTGVRYPCALAVPDTDLLPDIRAVLSDLKVPGLNEYSRVRITPALSASAALDWPYPSESMLAVNGGYEGLMLAIGTFIQAGDHVLVEDPSTPRTLDLLDRAGAVIHPVARDQAGMLPSALADGLSLHPVALVAQARIHGSLGAGLEVERRAELLNLLRPTDLLLIEDDGLGSLFDQVDTVLSSGHPNHLYVRSYSKSHSPDLRLAVVEGPPRVLDRVQQYREYGSGWTSRILQEALANLLADRHSQARVRAATGIYDERRRALVDALATRGVRLQGDGGLACWVPVVDEQYALVTLAAHGVSAYSGSRFQIVQGRPHVRVATARLPRGDATTVAEILALAVRPG